MEKNNIVRIIGTYLSGRFSPETEEKVQKWIIKDKDTEEKEKACNKFSAGSCLYIQNLIRDE